MQLLTMRLNVEFFAIANPNGFEKTDVGWQKLKNIAP